MSIEISNAVTKLINNIEEKPKAATAVFRASSYSETDSFVVQSQTRTFNTTIDEPRGLGGTDTGPNPVELLLSSLGGCQEIVYRAYAAVMGLSIDRIEVHAEGSLDLRGLLNLADVPSGFSQISFTTKIISDEPEEKIRQLAEVVEKHCPVMDTLMREVTVTGELEIIKSSDVSEPLHVVRPEAASN